MRNGVFLFNFIKYSGGRGAKVARPTWKELQLFRPLPWRAGWFAAFLPRGAMKRLWRTFRRTVFFPPIKEGREEWGRTFLWEDFAKTTTRNKLQITRLGHVYLIMEEIFPGEGKTPSAKFLSAFSHPYASVRGSTTTTTVIAAAAATVATAVITLCNPLGQWRHSTVARMLLWILTSAQQLPSSVVNLYVIARLFPVGYFLRHINNSQNIAELSASVRCKRQGRAV